MEVTPGVYRHYKGGLYCVVGVAEDRTTGEMKVIYSKKRSGGDLYVRSLWEFTQDAPDNTGPRFKRMSPVAAGC